MFKKIILLIVLIMMLAATCVSAVDTYGGYNVPVDIDINGSFIRCVQKPILINGTTYIPLRAFSDAVGGTVSWDGAARTAIMSKDGHMFAFNVETNTCTVDGITKEYMSVIYQDLTFIPVRAISDILGYTVSWDSFYLTVKIQAPGVEVPAWCKDASYQYEDILYLGKIVQIESGSQPFDAKLAVAGTIMNRVSSPTFPNTVKGVIFDTKYGTQFPPAHTSKINVTPSSESMIAAKCALGGVRILEKALYFIDTKSAPSSWAHRNRPHCGTVGGMSFYN